MKGKKINLPEGGIENYNINENNLTIQSVVSSTFLYKSINYRIREKIIFCMMNI